MKIRDEGSVRNESIYVAVDESAIKLLFLALRRFDKKWSRALWNWSGMLGRFAICFQGRIPTL